MKIGVNQLAILRRCYFKGHVGIKDVAIYYNIRIFRENRDRLIAVFEKLEICGLLVQCNVHNWQLTSNGKEVARNQLNLEKTGDNK